MQNRTGTVLHMPADAAAGAGGGAMQYAGFWARVGALLVDSAILTVVGLVLMIALRTAMGGAGVAIGNIVFFLVQLLYWPVMESSSRQATFGKRLMGIEVTGLDGARVSFVKALLRNLAKIVSSIPLGLGFLLAAFTARKQALHDIITSCLVVRTGPSSFLKALVAMIVAIAVAGYGGYYYVTKILLPQQMESAANGMGRDISREMERAMKQAEADMKRQMEKAAREAQQKRAARPPAAKAPAVATPGAAAPAPSKPVAVVVAPAKPAAVEVKPAPAPAKPAVVEVKPAPVPAKPVAAPAAGAEPMRASAPAAPARVARRPLAVPPPPAPINVTVKSPRYNDVMTAVMNRDRAGAVEALDAGMWVDRSATDGVTPLMAAALNGDAAMVQLLLQHGADPGRHGPAGSVLEYANRGGNAQVVALLRKASAR